MGITFQPRRVERPALRRWLIEGGRLLARHPGIWLLSSLLSGGATLAAATSVIGTLFITVVSYLLFIAVPHGLDSSRPGAPGLGPTVRTSLPVALFYAGAMACGFGALSIVMGLHVFDDPWVALYDPTRTFGLPAPSVFGISLRVFATFMVALVLGAYFVQWFPGSSPFAYHLMALNGSDRPTAVALSDEAVRLNRLPVYLLAGVPFGITVVIFVVALPVAPLAACYCAAVSYAAYRDIFLGIAHRKETAREASLQSTASLTR